MTAAPTTSFDLTNGAVVGDLDLDTAYFDLNPAPGDTGSSSWGIDFITSDPFASNTFTPEGEIA
jgi:hypothetical protein